VRTKVDPKTHVNVIDGLLDRLKKRSGIVCLKRLTIILDEDSEKGFGLVRRLSSIPPFQLADSLYSL
jgi:ribonuclease P/MRP protein subunit RPP1